MLIAAFAPYMTYKFVSFMGADMYHLMSAEQEAKSALNRPLPIRTTLGSPASVLNSGSSDTQTPPTPAPAPDSGSTQTVASTSSETGASNTAASGSTTGAAGGAAAGGAAAGVGAAVIVVEETATAGPKLGGAVSEAAMGTSEATQPIPPSQPAPRTTFTPTSPPPSPEV